MTPEAQRMAIAEACAPMKGAETPDYLNDLNAMHEAEKTLAPIKIRRYVGELWFTMCEDNVAGQMEIGTIHATARQRAEAFLRTIGKWEES